MVDKEETKRIMEEHGLDKEQAEKVQEIITGPAPQSHTDCKYCQYRSRV